MTASPAVQEAALREVLAAVRGRDSLRVQRVELTGCTRDPRGLIVHLASSAGRHHIPVRRTNWAELDPVEIADYVAQKVINEIRWRRYVAGGPDEA